MNKEIILPFTWDEWDQNDVLALQLYNVTFTEDFGVFKKGEVIKCLSVNYGTGIIEDFNEDGTKVMRKQLFKAIAI